MAYLDTINKVWGMVRESFRDKMSETTIDLWFGELVISSFDGKTLKMNTESEMKCNIISEKYLSMIQKRFSDILGFEITVDLNFTGTPANVEEYKRRICIANGKTVDPDDSEVTPVQKDGQTKEQIIGSTIPPFNFEYTFDNFIVGNSNKFAHAACIAVSEHPAMDYNPLFIYGPSGIGKTHLLYAVTNAFKQKNNDVSVIYIKSEDFTNQMIDSLANQAMNEFREKYRTCDVLLIDDIQFIAGKVATQEEFFHTFNALYEDGKQIILTSDRPPRDIKTLEDRLKSRFEWGLIADIQPPDIELRIAIIKKKAEQAHINISEDVLYYLAENLRTNIRQIEGAILKLSAKHFISGETINLEMTKGCIAELLGGAEPVSVTVDKIFTYIYRKYGIKKEDLTGTKRTKDIALVRHITIYVIREITDMSLPSIGKLFERDHTTIMSSIYTINKKITDSPEFKNEMENLIKEIKES